MVYPVGMGLGLGLTQTMVATVGFGEVDAD